MAMINTIILEDLVDHDYVAKCTVGYEELKAPATDCTPELAERITGVPADEVRKRHTWTQDSLGLALLG
jgi:anaerobic selenocysteine-containing dehydrogenase